MMEKEGALKQTKKLSNVDNHTRKGSIFPLSILGGEDFAECAPLVPWLGHLCPWLRTHQAMVVCVQWCCCLRSRHRGGRGALAALEVAHLHGSEDDAVEGGVGARAVTKMRQPGQQG